MGTVTGPTFHLYKCRLGDFSTYSRRWAIGGTWKMKLTHLPFYKGWPYDSLLGGGFIHILYFYPDPWGDDPIAQAYFSNGLRPPTSLPFSNLQLWFLCFRECNSQAEEMNRTPENHHGFRFSVGGVVLLREESTSRKITNSFVVMVSPELWQMDVSLGYTYH